MTTAKVQLGLEASLLGSYSGSKRANEGSSSEKETSITLVLGDPDDADQFTLDIYLDPLYNTLLFDVRTGISSCPWEGEPTTRLHGRSVADISLHLTSND